MPMNRHELAAAIYGVSHLTGTFRLRSGAVSNQYFDKYRFESQPLLLKSIADALSDLVPADTEVLAGLELGGVPLATVLSQATGLPAVFVRKAPKSYGTGRLAEGAEIAGRRLLVVEDVVTSGGQVLESTQALRSLGAEVAAALCVIDRESDGVGVLRTAGVELHSLFRISELEAAAQHCDGADGADLPRERRGSSLTLGRRAPPLRT
jgi:orotate phosphoribosyltransferase